MTFQALNLIYLNEQQVGFAGIDGKGLLIPSDFGIKTRSASSGCWRGYIMHYEIKNDEIYMLGFWVRTKNGVNPPEINGVAPKPLAKRYDPDGLHGLGFTHEYKNVNLKLPFTGTIWLLRNLNSASYVPIEPSEFEFFGTRIPPVIFDLKFEFQEGTVINIEESQERTI